MGNPTNVTPDNTMSATVKSVDESSADHGRAEKIVTHQPVDSLPPEEGVRGWLCVLGGFFTLTVSFGFLNAVGVFQSYYQENSLRDYTPSDIAWIFAIQLALMWAPGPLFGRLTDTYGPRPVLYPCAVLCVFSLCMTSLCTEFYQIFLAQGLGYGIGAGGVFTSTFVCIGQWFVQRRGFATGVAGVGSGVGGIIFPLFLYNVIEKVGFNGAVRYTALLVALLLLAGCFLITSRLPPKKWDWNARWFDARLFKDPKFAAYTFGAFFVMWGLWVPFDFVTSFGISQNFSRELSLSLISMINAMSIPGRILPPYLADVVGHFNVITVSSYLTGFSILCLWLPFDFYTSLAGTIVFSLVYGFTSGALVSLLMPCVAKTGPIETIGMRFGTFQLILSLSTLTGLPIGGAILARQGDGVYWGMQTFAAVSITLGASLMSVAIHFLSRAHGSWRV